jgi:hypothetical protein
MPELPGLPDDWRPAHRVWFEQAWAEHADKELLDERQAERDQDGQPTWHARRKLLDDGWVEYWLEPIQPTDARSPIRIAAWPEKRETDAQADAEAIVDEHHLD